MSALGLRLESRSHLSRLGSSTVLVFFGIPARASGAAIGEREGPMFCAVSAVDVGVRSVAVDVAGGGEPHTSSRCHLGNFCTAVNFTQ